MRFLAGLWLCTALWSTDAIRIWDRSPYNAFTDLIEYRGQILCGFREAPTHHARDGYGTIRILARNTDGTWRSLSELRDPRYDLRDPKFSITPSGELMMSLGAVIDEAKGAERIRTLAYFSRDGKTWSDPVQIGETGFWLWRINWHAGKAYSVAYQGGGSGVLRIYVSDDGRKFRTLLDDMRVPDYGNEATLVFRADGTAHCFVRRDKGTMSALWGTSNAPYTAWSWKDLGTRVGGPHVIEAPDGRMLGVLRYIDEEGRRVSVVEITRDGRMLELEKLPSSNGDSGYAGLLWKNGELWTSYYSTHENRRTSIFFARWRPN